MALMHPEHHLTLKPFEPIAGDTIQLEVLIYRLSHGRLHVEFVLHDPEGHVLWPHPAPLPLRADFLWEHTCFEVFIAQDEYDSYTEFNFSPRRQWNAYHFDHYRHPKQMPPLHERQVNVAELQVGHHRLEAVLELTPRFAARATVHLNVCAVLAHPRGHLSYWSIQHGGEVADFHRASDRVITIDLLR
jgi:hypothetical protein